MNAAPHPPLQPTGLIARISRMSNKPPMVAYLGALLLLGAFVQQNGAVLVRSAVLLGTYTVLDMAAGFWREKKLLLPSSAWVSGLVLALVLSPRAPWIAVIGAPVLASAGKHFLRIRRTHVFNPAALSLVLLSMVLPEHVIVSWWGASWGSLATLIIAVIGVVTVIRVKRWKTALAFAAIYGGIGALLRTDIAFLPALVTLLWDGTFLFFATVMLIEPVTTAYTPAPIRIWFGAFAGLLAILFSLPPITRLMLDPFLTALVFGNATGVAATRLVRRWSRS